MNTLRVLIISVIVLVLTTSLASAEKLKDTPGYLDLEWIDIPSYAEEYHDIDLSVMLLSIAEDAKETGDEELAELLAMIKSVRVKAFSVDPDDNRATRRVVEKVNQTLKDDGWRSFIRTKSEDETLTVSTAYDDNNKIVGLMLVVFEPGDSVAFVNVVGDLNLSTLVRLAHKMDTDEMQEVFEKMEDIQDH